MKDKYISVFLSSAMTGELGIERNSVRTLFRENSTIKSFYDLFAIEEHASPDAIERAFTKEVQNSNIVIILLGDEYRDAVIKEYQTARLSDKLIFIYIKHPKQRSTKLSEFISSEVYKYNPGTFHDTIDLCDKIKQDLRSDLFNAYNPKLPMHSEDVPYVVTQAAYPYSLDSYYPYDTIQTTAGSENIKSLSTDQLIQFSLILADDSGDLRGALLLLEVAILKDPDNWMLHNNRGQLLNKMGFIRNSIHAYKNSSVLKPDSDVALYNIGGAYYELGQYSDAIRYMMEALKYEPKKESALSRLSACYLRLNEGVKALKFAKQAIRLDESESNIINLSSSHALVGEFEKAIEVAAKLTSKSNKYKVLLAHIYYQQKDYEQAIHIIGEIESTEKLDYQTALVKYHCLLFHIGSESALNWLSEMDMRFPVRPADYNDMAYSLLGVEGSSDTVTHILRKCVDQDPTIPEAWQNLQSNLGALEENEEGLKVCDEALRHHPFDPKSISNRMKFLMNLGRYSELVQFTYEKAFGVFGNDMNSDIFGKELKKVFPQMVDIIKATTEQNPSAIEFDLSNSDNVDD